jgi:hypothetical protein
LRSLPEARGAVRSAGGTVERYNDWSKNGRDQDFGVPARFLAVREGPFYAAKSGAFCTLPHGLHVDCNSQF